MALPVMLPPAEMLEAHKIQSLITRPEAKRLSNLDMEIANILARDDISDHEKMDMFWNCTQTIPTNKS